MEDNKKRVADSAGKSGSPKKQRVAKKGASAKGKKKDQNKPKRPMTAYFFFLASAREKLRKKRNAGEQDVPTKIGDIAKYAGNEWKQMTTEQKKPFVDLHLEAKKEYDQQLQQVQPTRDENKPKKPTTAFFLFLEDFREKKKGQNEDGKKIPSLAGEKWRSMSDEDKKDYVERADAAKQRYEVQMKEYLAKNPEITAQKGKKSKAKVKEASESDEEDEEDEDDENDDDEDEEEDEDDDSD